jgi:hypothetical protein
VRIGLSETKKFAEGYEAIFGKKQEKKEPAAKPAKAAKKAAPKKKAAAKKKSTKK